MGIVAVDLVLVDLKLESSLGGLKKKATLINSEAIIPTTIPPKDTANKNSITTKRAMSNIASS